MTTYCMNQYRLTVWSEYEKSEISGFKLHMNTTINSFDPIIIPLALYSCAIN